MPKTCLIPSNIGSNAFELLTQAREAQVWGATSRGVFLHLPSGWVVFLSAEPFRGPLTLNLCGREHHVELPPALEAAVRGTAIEICAGEIHFNSLDLTIIFEPASSWSAPHLPDAPPERLTQRLQRLEKVIQGMQKADSCQLSAISFQQSVVDDHTCALDIQALTGELTENLGLGAGLTPAGDDLALGFLLAANRWKGLLCPGLDLRPVNHEIQHAAYARTSTLSANLIECATQGQADERLILALDGIITGQPEPETCISYLSGWGSSSGAWALQGMALAIQCST